jgi:NitT/TauT family transport system substrate-binding protein
MGGSLFRKCISGIALAITILGWWSCRQGAGPAPAGNPLKLSLAVVKEPYSGLIAVADDMGYFRQEGLEVTLLYFPSGLDALEEACLGGAHAATVSAMAFAGMAQKYPTLRIVASLASNPGSRIVARKDRGIGKPADLMGKKIGFTADTESEYLLFAFLLTEDIPLKSVTMVDLPPNRQAEAIANGEVDAVSAFEMNAFEATKRLVGNAVSWSPDISSHWLLAALETSLRPSGPMERLLKALLRAKSYLNDHEEEVQEILARKWGLDPAFLQDSLQRSRLDVSFNQAIVTSQINYAAWHMRKSGKAGPPPDVMDFMYVGILEKVAPETVTVVR